MRLEDLRNVGRVSAQRLRAVGIESVLDLEEAGPVEAYRKVRDAYPDETTRNLLWALAGALLDIDWRDLPEGLKQRMLAEAGE